MRGIVLLRFLKMFVFFVFLFFRLINIRKGRGIGGFVLALFSIMSLGGLFIFYGFGFFVFKLRRFL